MAIKPCAEHKKDLKEWVLEIAEDEKDGIIKQIEEETDKLLNSGFIEPSDCEKYPLQKIILYCVLKRVAESYRPLGKWKKYSQLINNY